MTCIPSRTACSFIFRRFLPDDVFQVAPVSCVDFLHFCLKSSFTIRVTVLHQEGSVAVLVRDPVLLVLEILCRTLKKLNTQNNTGAEGSQAFLTISNSKNSFLLTVVLWENRASVLLQLILQLRRYVVWFCWTCEQQFLHFTQQLLKELYLNYSCMNCNVCRPEM